MMRGPSPELSALLKAYDPTVVELYLAAREVVLTAAPRANELIYDAYNAVTTAYSFSDRLPDAFCHVAAYRAYVNLGFNRGAELPDPRHLLLGTGAKIRHLRIATIDDLREPGVRDLLRAAIAQGKSCCAKPTGEPRAVVKAVYGKKRRPHLRTSAKRKT
ncbi:MAG: hypothetical protein AB7O59_06240 [Pirellulales bacterium]